MGVVERLETKFLVVLSVELLGSILEITQNVLVVKEVKLT